LELQLELGQIRDEELKIICSVFIPFFRFPSPPNPLVQIKTPDEIVYVLVEDAAWDQYESPVLAG